ncbi:MAG: UvrD-helicase domain-containing protein, partial [Cytophaga sp.]|uniref:UvrD-helicase domain-containing protein n=1 Tax=Cytophaga sp. TaxID=29535 RepID=UPI003F80A14A
MTPSQQQQQIIDYDSNAVIIAAPGSGKTFVVSKKIEGILKSLKDHEGLIAISYTNKASTELKERSLKNGINSKSSFFGTIDKFFISEIIIPFGKHMFGLPTKDIKVIKIENLEQEEKHNFDWFNPDLTIDKLLSENIDVLKQHFINGNILLNTVGVLANYIFSNSIACRKYIKAKYRYIFIDEYQDSGNNQHDIFIKINQLGIIGIAVGDLNQSIYEFSGKSSYYLDALTKKTEFQLFNLTKNHRCHSSIINYSNYLLDPNVQLLPIDKSRVCFFRIEGNEVSIAKWIDKFLMSIKTEFSV